MRSETMISHPRFHVTRRVGTEGPRFDPYEYQELCVRTDTSTVVLHEGLGVWLTCNGQKHEAHTLFPNAQFQAYDHLMRKHFASIVGFTVEQIERIDRKLHARCRNCGHNDFEYQHGYPGETFAVCSVCKHVHASSMNYSAIE